jgi:hypothetical protein
VLALNFEQRAIERSAGTTGIFEPNEERGEVVPLGSQAADDGHNLPSFSPFNRQRGGLFCR